MKLPLSLYLNRAKKIKIIPNFFISDPYLFLNNVKIKLSNGWVWIEDEEWLLFPPISLTNSINHHCPFIFKLKPVWSDFEFLQPTNLIQKEFLDWEYIFNPIHFNYLSGGKWETYRKNIRKWPKSHANWEYRWDYSGTTNDIRLLLVEWIEEREKDIQDCDLIVSYILGNMLGIYIKYLYHNNELYAINVWDENWHYINYRFCIIKKGQPFLDEFARYLFYTDPDIQQKQKLVNDGGSLDSEGLERFKDKLNPVKKRKVYSWLK